MPGDDALDSHLISQSTLLLKTVRQVGGKEYQEYFASLQLGRVLVKDGDWELASQNWLFQKTFI